MTLRFTSCLPKVLLYFGIALTFTVVVVLLLHYYHHVAGVFFQHNCDDNEVLQQQNRRTHSRAFVHMSEAHCKKKCFILQRRSIYNFKIPSIGNSFKP